MSKYIGPRLKIIRRLGLLPGLTNKNVKIRTKTPGQHGSVSFSKGKRSSVSDDYKLRLLEKQKIRFNYGLTEKQLLAYYNKAKTKKNITGNTLLNFLEFRLDCIVYRLGFANTIPAARQIINHGHILVNNKKLNIPSFLCSVNDIISIKEKSKHKFLLNLKKTQEQRALIATRLKQLDLIKSRFTQLLPAHLIIDDKLLVGKICLPLKRKDVLVKVNELKVVEYYSK